MGMISWLWANEGELSVEDIHFKVHYNSKSDAEYAKEVLKAFQDAWRYLYDDLQFGSRRSMPVWVTNVHIRKDLEYPGQIKVTLIREMRVVDYAK